MKRTLIRCIILLVGVASLAAVVHRVGRVRRDAVLMELAPPHRDDRNFRIRVLDKSDNWGCSADGSRPNERLVLTMPTDVDRILIAFDPKNQRRFYDKLNFIPKGARLVLDPRTQTYFRSVRDFADEGLEQFFGRDGLYVLFAVPGSDLVNRTKPVASCKVLVWHGPALPQPTISAPPMLPPVTPGYTMRILDKSEGLDCHVEKAGADDRLVLAMPADKPREMAAMDPAGHWLYVPGGEFFIPGGTKLVLNPKDQIAIDDGEPEGRHPSKPFFSRPGLYDFLISDNLEEDWELIDLQFTCRVLVSNPAQSQQSPPIPPRAIPPRRRDRPRPAG